MDNLVTLCLLGLFVVIGLILLPRLLRGFGGPDYSQPGGTRPEYDDPNINSRGSLGQPSGGDSPTYDSPKVQSRGVFGRSRGSSSTPSSSSGGNARRYDTPNVQSRGSFGRSKK